MIQTARFLMPLFAGLTVLALAAHAQPAPGPGPGPGGPGPGDPPRTTPGLDPVTLAGIASAGYLGFQALKHRRK